MEPPPSPEQGLTLRGSADLVAEIFSFGLHSILYQRLYPSETFSRVHKYGLELLVCKDPDLLLYLSRVLDQLKDWLYSCSVQKLVVVISNTASGDVLERWQFDIECDKAAPGEASLHSIQADVRSVIEQIAATVPFLPLLQGACSFDLLIYTDRDLVVPDRWEECGPQTIAHAEEVRLRSFSTSIHRVNGRVTYKVPVDK